MHILIISQYFHPEIGAASERLTGFARNLSRSGHKLTVITGFPNYPMDKKYPGYHKKLFSIEKFEDVRVLRVWLFTSAKTGVVPRVFNYLSFMLSSIFAGISVRKVDRVIATSGPIFAAASGYVVSLLKKAPFILDVRDIWPERIYAGTDMKRGNAIGILERLEKFLYEHASKIIAVTGGVKKNILSKGIDSGKVSLITNGVDMDIFKRQPRNDRLAETLEIGQDTFVIIYAGTLGLLQDLDIMAGCAERLQDYSDIVFLIVGGGARRDEFARMVEERGLRNVIMAPPVSSTELNDYINLSHVGINANTNHPHNDMAIPVKMFTYMACGKPVVLANTGEIAEVVGTYRIGECVPPGDDEAFSNAVLKLYNNRQLREDCGANGHALVLEKFSSGKLSEQLLSFLE